MFNFFTLKNKWNLYGLDKIYNKIDFKYVEYLVAQTKKNTLFIKHDLDRIKNSNCNQKEKLLLAIAVAIAGFRVSLGIDYFKPQIIGGIALTNRTIVEMQTGEGKTFVSTIACVINYVFNIPTHIATANEYLSNRDFLINKPFFDLLGITSSCTLEQDPIEQKKEAYSSWVLFSTMKTLVFDYLKDGLCLNAKELRVGIKYENVNLIVDEADFILLDEATSPMMICLNQNRFDIRLYEIFHNLVKQLTPGKEPEENQIYSKTENQNIKFDFLINEKQGKIQITENGYKKIEKLLVEYLKDKNETNILNIKEYENNFLYQTENLWIIHEILNALKATFLFIKDVNYIIIDKKVSIVDSNTGRTSVGKQWVKGLHQAIEYKEKLLITEEKSPTSKISIQQFSQMYKNISGMTGTAIESKEEFLYVYGCNTIKIPTNKPCIRKENIDSIFFKKEIKERNIIKDVREKFLSGRPLLIGTTGIKESEDLSLLLEKEKIPHEVLNAKNHKAESQIVAYAGCLHSVTIATNMAGRGVDIILGGDTQGIKNHLLGLKKLIFLLRDKIENFNLNQFNPIKDTISTHTEINQKEEQLLKIADNIKNGIDDINVYIQNFIKIEACCTKLISEINQFNFLSQNSVNKINFALKACLDVIDYHLVVLSAGAKEKMNSVMALGGLYVLGASRNKTRRIDNQLKGRCARQGNPGESKFYLSFEDDWLVPFTKNSIILNVKNQAGDTALVYSSMVDKIIKKAQEQIESLFFNTRKSIYLQDHAITQSRKIFLDLRSKILLNELEAKDFLLSNIKEKLKQLKNDAFLDSTICQKEDCMEEVNVAKCVDMAFSVRLNKEKKEKFLILLISQVFNIPKETSKKIIFCQQNNFNYLNNRVSDDRLKTGSEDLFIYNIIINYIESKYSNKEIQHIILNEMDRLWEGFLENTDEMRQGINLVSYIGKNPIIEYQSKVFVAFKELVFNLNANLLNLFA